MEDNQFHRNLEVWGRSHPKEALLIPYIDDSELHDCQTEKKESNLYLECNGIRETYHSQDGALQEAKKWFSTIDQKHTGVLYIYGIGLGYYYTAAAEWLHENNSRSIVFLEDDLAVLRKFFETELAEQMLLDPQVRIIYLQDQAIKKVILGDIYWYVALTEAKVSALNYYKEKKKDIYESLSHEIDYSTELKKALLEEYLEFGGVYFKNFYQNLLYLPQSYRGNHFFGKFKKVPAIICGAGPSLEKNMHLLKQLKDRAIIFAGGSAINVLNSASIQPHLCAGIDPNEAQNVRLHHAQAYEVPFFYRNRLNHNAFKTIHGPRLYLTGGGGFDVAEFFESKLNIQGKDIEEGENVVTFCLEIAFAMGCDPIIFLGLDLAFTDRKTYSGGVVFDPAVEQKTMDIYANFETTGLVKKDIYGEPIHTLWKWIAESEWIGQWAKENPKVHLINCTEGGLGCPSVENAPLKETAEKLLTNQYDLSNRIHTEIQNAQMPKMTMESVREAMVELKASLVRCQENYSILIEESEITANQFSQSDAQEAPIQSWKAALAETDLAEESAFPAVLAIFNKVSSYLSNSEFQQIKYDPTLLTEQQRQIKRFELNRERFRFLSTVAKISEELIDYAFEEYDHRSKRPVEPKPEQGPEFRKEVLTPPLQWPKPANEDESVEFLYYKSGTIKAETHFKKGLLNGPSLYYSKKNVLLAKSNFVNGLAEGESLCYYPSGALYSRQYFVNGVLEGKQEYFNKNGSVKTTLQYKQGCLVGTAHLYGVEGTLERIIDFNKE